MSRGGLIEAGLTTPEASTVTSLSPTFTMPYTNLQTTHRIPCYQIISNIHYTGWPKKNSTMSANKDVNRVLCKLMVSSNASSCFDAIEAKNTENCRKYEKSERNKCNEVTGSSGSSSHLLNLIFSARCTINTPTSPNTRICVFVYFDIFV